MVQTELLEYAQAAVGWLVKGGAAYFAALLGAQAFIKGSLFRERIRDQLGLELVVAQEAIRLGMDPLSVRANLSNYNTSHIGRKWGLKAELHISAGFGASRGRVRHELYHKLRDFNRKEPLSTLDPRHLFLEEPRATIYGCFGIRL